MVWQAAQLRVKRVLPDSRSAPAVFTIGTWVPTPGVSDWTHAAISRVWMRLKRGGLRVACALVLASGMRPVDTQKSTVPAPRPCNGGATTVPFREVPRASGPWQLAQLAAKRAWPGAMNDAGRSV